MSLISIHTRAVARRVRAIVAKLKRPAEPIGKNSGTEREEVSAPTQVVLPIGPACC